MVDARWSIVDRDGEIVVDLQCSVLINVEIDMYLWLLSTSDGHERDHALVRECTPW